MEYEIVRDVIEADRAAGGSLGQVAFWIAIMVLGIKWTKPVSDLVASIRGGGGANEALSGMDASFKQNLVFFGQAVAGIGKMIDLLTAIHKEQEEQTTILRTIHDDLIRNGRRQ